MERFHVFLTSDSLRGILLETSRHPNLECIVQMPGVRIGNDFYFDMVADSGIHATYEYAMCEKDHEYADHLSTRLSEYYDIPPKLLTLSQVHKHPPNCERFSPGDRPANVALAKQFGGVVNGLILVNPDFKLKFWYIDEEGDEIPVPYTVDNAAVRDAMPKKSLKALQRKVEEQEASGHGRYFGEEGSDRGSHRWFHIGLGRRRKNAGKGIAVQDRESALDMLSLDIELLNEMKEISCGTDITVRRSGNHMLTMSIDGQDGKKRSIHVRAEGKTLYVNDGTGEYRYRAGDLKRLFQLEGKNVENNNTLFEMADQEEIDLEALVDENRPYTVFMPEEYRSRKYEGLLRGYYIAETRTFNVVPEEAAGIRRDCAVIGEARREELPLSAGLADENFVAVIWKEDGAEAVRPNSDAPVKLEFYSLEKDIFSRNQGILESSRMKDKQAVIPGVGSGGSFLALELAKAGIGSLILADDDRFAYQNICRHQCGIHDVGKYKVDALAERIADINPFCKVYTFRDMIQHVDPAALKAVLWEKSIILCSADNRHAAYICNELADEYHIPMVDAGCGPRASTGEIYYYKPDCGMPCYTCAYGEDTGVDHSDQAVRRAFYATESELEKLHFQPGMSLDIVQTAIFQTKLAIDLLMEGEEGYEAKLLPYVKQCTILLNYPVDKAVNPYMRLFEGRNVNTDRRPLVWKTGPVEKNKDCAYCAKKK